MHVAKTKLDFFIYLTGYLGLYFILKLNNMLLLKIKIAYCGDAGRRQLEWELFTFNGYVTLLQTAIFCYF